MRKSTLLILLIAALTVFSTIVCVADAPDSSYVMTLNDEFDGDALNTDIWTHRAGNPYGGKNLLENVRVADGKLYLDYRKVDGYYTGGGILTMADLPYGYYETKAKIYTGANGFHTSFWSASGSGARNVKAPRDPQVNGVLEIDGFEFNSNETDTAPRPAYNFHYWWADHTSTGGNYYDCDTDGNASTSDWFTMGYEWLPGKIIFYCNGVEVGSIIPNVYNPSALWLTAVAMPEDYTELNGTINIDDTKMDENGFFGSSEYEYFRYYNKPLKGVNLLGNGHFELNRDTKLAYPRAFYITGLVSPTATPLSHSGFYSMHMFKGSTMGRELAYIAPGKYTFEGYFKTKGATARLAVYDKNDTLIKSLSIPSSAEAWTKVSLKDIQISDFAYVVVETTDGEVLVDDLSFYCQEGLEGYENYKETDYENYSAFKKADSTATVVPSEDAVMSDHDWKSSSLTDTRNYYASASILNYSKIGATWETTITKDEKFDVFVYQILHENNTSKQNYTVTLDGVAVASNVSVPTRDGTTTAGNWYKLCTIEATKGQVVKVTLSIPKIGLFSDDGGYARITPVKILGYDDKFLDDAFIAQFSTPVFQYKNTPYLFDESDIELSPYKRGDELYIPYQTLKNFITVPGADASAKYVTSSQINASGTHKIIKSGSMVIIYPAEYTPTENAIEKLISYFGNFKSSFLYSKGKTAEYVGTTDMPYQEVSLVTDATLNKSWGNSTLGYAGTSRYAGNNSATATWEISAKHTATYSLEFYNIVHAGAVAGSSPSTTSAGVDISVLGSIYSYRLNQCDGQMGWYSLGQFDLEANDTIFIDLYNASDSGLLRANAVRLVPIFETATFEGTADKSTQKYYSHTDAEKKGTWQEENGVIKAVYSEENKDASLKWTVSPDKSNVYKIQIYSPKSETTATSGAKVSLTINDETTNYLINQKTSDEGWYELAEVELDADDIATIELSNLSKENSVYAKGVRILPAFEIPVFVNDTDMLTQEYHNHETATKIGSWQNSGGDYTGCCTAPTAENSDAEIIWNVTPAKNAQYSVQVYVPKYTMSGSSNATVTLDINGKATKFSVYQRADSSENTGNGWYELGTFNLKTTDSLSVSIKNRSNDGWLRAKAIRLVPASEAKYASVQNVLINNYYGPEVAEKVGEWLYSGGEYSGCMYAQHKAGNTNASINWDFAPDSNTAYDVQVFIPKYTTTATSGAEITLDINGKLATFVVDQRKESDENTGSGWYSLGTYNLKTTDAVSLTFTNKAKESFLRVKGIRFIPSVVAPLYVGLDNEENQELHAYNTATLEGDWKSSTAVLGVTSYYGSGSSTITWNPVPKKSQKYSIQVYMPHHTSGSTRSAYVTLTINGLSHTFSNINQNSDPSDGTGWYDLGVYDLTTTSNITVKIGKDSGTFVRAKDIRLVPYPGSVIVKKSGSTVTATLGTMCNYAKTVLFAEYDDEGVLVSSQILDSAPSLNITMNNANNDYKLFYWKNIHTMIPVVQSYSSK